MRIRTGTKHRNFMLTPEQIHQFNAQGFLLVEDFYSPTQELAPLKQAIHRIIGLVIDRYHPDIPHPPTPFDAGYIALITRERRLGGVIYDAVKQLPEFVRLVACTKNTAVVQALRQSESVGIARNGDGIRINNPHETAYMAPWHQEYPSQFRSQDGVVFWAPLHDITADMGPVELCIGSHKDGIRPICYDSEEHTGTAYGLELHEETAVIGHYGKIAPLPKEGDVLLMDFLTLHRSGYNAADVARWSMQLRYFNYEHESGRKMDWAGGFLSGRTIDELMPEIIRKKDNPAS